MHLPNVVADLDLRVAAFLDGLRDVAPSTVEVAILVDTVLQEGDPGLAAGDPLGTG
jgi:hypothetical protein